MINTKLGYQLLGNPPDGYKSKSGGGKIMKIVGNESDLNHLNDWYGKVEILQARLAALDDDGSIVRNAYARNDLSEIPKLADTIADMIEGVNNRIGKHLHIWWEIAPIMPAVVAQNKPDGTLTSWIGEWNAAVAERLAAREIRSVCFGFATGMPQVKPFANTGGHGPDEWPALYPALRRLNKLGKTWTRIGVEEYIVGGRFAPEDFSNVGRVQYVYQNHFIPLGLRDLLFRGIEGSFDLPGRADVEWMTPDFYWEQMWLVDARYANMPYLDAMALYAVCDPTNNESESSFAITPGDKHQERGYLEIGQEYFADNPPSAGPVELPPIETPPPPPPPETVVIFENHFDRFEPRLFADGIGDIMIPPGFEIGYLTGKNYGQLHGELSPSRETGVLKPDTFIFHVMGRMNAWLRVVFPTTPGDVIRLTVETSAAVDKVNRSIGLATDARESPTELERVTISDPTHQVITQTITATRKSMSAFWQAFTDQTIRSDARIHSMKIERVGVGVPLPPPDPAFPAWYRVATGDTARLRKRLAPVDGEIIELQVNGSELKIESIVDGWAKEYKAGLYASAQYLIRIRGA